MPGDSGVIQWVTALPGETSADHKLAELFQILADALPCQLWMPANTSLGSSSPWNRSVCLSRLRASLHPTPRLVVYSSAADAHVLQRAYGQARTLRRLHLIASAHPESWSHGARSLPSIRVALGEPLAQGLGYSNLFLEPITALPLGISSEGLPPTVPQQQRQGPLLLLAEQDPGLGLAVQERLERQGQASQCEITPWPHQRWLEAMACAPAVLVLAGAQPRQAFCQRRLNAMALDTLLVVDPGGPEEGLCRDGSNALVRPGDAQELSRALLHLMDPGQRDLQQRLREGARRTLLLHRPALQQQRWLAMLQSELSSLWQQVQGHS